MHNTEAKVLALAQANFTRSPDTIFSRIVTRLVQIHNVDYDSLRSSPFHAPAMNTMSLQLSPSSRAHMPNGTTIPQIQRANYEPPWANTSIIGIAGSSGSGKTSLSLAIIQELSLPWVVLMSMDSFYRPLTPEQSAAAFRNEFDFDAPDAIDFDVLFERLKDLKAGYHGPISWTIEVRAN